LEAPVTEAGFSGRLLAFETSGFLAGVAVAAGGRILGEVALDTRVSRTEVLLESLRRLLEDLRIAPGDLDRVVYDEGPGSFTGLRVGMAAALGVAYAAGCPVIAVPSLEVLAYPHRLSGVPVVALSGHRRGLVYGAVYEWSGAAFLPRIEPGSFPVEDALDRLSCLPGERLLFVGDALDSLAEPIRLRLGSRAWIGPVEPARAAHLAALGMDPDRAVGAGRSLEGRTPRYLRDADARKPRRQP
jgi:tRNA threonylcarbamoyladenosine biosynthesis protein TsaB